MAGSDVRRAQGAGDAPNCTPRIAAAPDVIAERHHALAVNIEQGYCVVELMHDDAANVVDYRFLEVNPAFLRLTNFVNPVGRRIRELSPNHEAVWFEMFGRASQNGEAVRFQQHAAAQGREFDVCAYPIGDPRDRRVGVLIDDVSDRRRTESALLESEEQYRTLVESARDYAMFLIDIEGRVNSWNVGAERIFGYGEEEILHRSAAILFTEEDQEADIPAKELAVAAQEGRALDDRWQRRKNGSRFWASGLTMSRRDESGGLVGYTKVLRDDTWRKQHEEQIQTIMQELNHRVKNTLAVVQAVAHQTLRGATNLMTFASEFDRRLQSIAGAHRLLTRANWKGAAIQDILHSELSVSAPSMEQISFEGPPVVLSPKEALAMHMVIHELTTNALKFGALQTAEGRLHIRWRTTGSYDDSLELKWEEHCPHRITRPEGPGYGSELLQKIVEYELAGEIQQEFAPSGMRCRLCFPLHRARSGHPETNEAMVAPAPGVGGVLVVEDSAALAMKLCDDLEDSGYAVVGPAARLEQAMELARSESICAAVLDVDLNGTKVYPLARALREQKVPFVLLTGYEVESLPEDLRDAVVLSKPLTSNAVADFLREHC